MKEWMLNARFNIVHVLKQHSNQTVLVPITCKLIKANVAHQAHNSYLESERKKKIQFELQKKEENRRKKKKTRKKLLILKKVARFKQKCKRAGSGIKQVNL